MHSLLLPLGLTTPPAPPSSTRPSFPLRQQLCIPLQHCSQPSRAPAAPTPVAYYPGPATQLYMNYSVLPQVRSKNFSLALLSWFVGGS